MFSQEVPQYGRLLLDRPIANRPQVSNPPHKATEAATKSNAAMSRGMAGMSAQWRLLKRKVRISKPLSLVLAIDKEPEALAPHDRGTVKVANASGSVSRSHTAGTLSRSRSLSMRSN